MSLARTRLHSALVLTLVAGGCRVFDPELYMHRDGGADTATDAPVTEAGSDGGTPTLALGETCADSTPLASPGVEYLIDTSTLSNDVTDVNCIASSLQGRDGVFRVAMSAGEKWHFHVKVTSDTTAQPVVYVLPNCDERNCSTGEGVDECPSGKDEHITYIARTSGDHFVAIDSTVPDAGSPYRVLVVRVVCGDGVLQHSEGCDNGNGADGGTGNGDGTGCDSQCRYELTPALANHITEQEPNDDFSDANVIRIVDTDGGASGYGSLTINGSILTRCEYDTYAVHIPMGGGALAVSMLDGNGNACGGTVLSAVSTISMTLYGSDNHTPIAMGANVGTDTCPTLDPTMQAGANHLAEGDYLVRITTATHVNPADGSTTALQYRLKFDVTPPL